MSDDGFVDVAQISEVRFVICDDIQLLSDVVFVFVVLWKETKCAMDDDVLMQLELIQSNLMCKCWFLN